MLPAQFCLIKGSGGRLGVKSASSLAPGCTRGGVLCQRGTGSTQAWGDTKKQRKRLVALHVHFLKRLLRVPHGMATKLVGGTNLVVRGLGMEGLKLEWLCRTLRFFNSHAQAPADSLHGAEASADSHDAVSGRVHNWAWGLRKRLQNLRYVLPQHKAVCLCWTLMSS